MEQPSEPEEQEGVSGERTRKRKERTYSAHVLPSNRNPFQVHFDVLRRFVAMARSGEGVQAAQVEGNGVPVQAASMNVRFMRTIGLLTATERGRYAPTPEAIRFVNARTVSDAKARPILVGLIGQSWFADQARSIFATQPLMSEELFIGELAMAAQTDRAKEGPALRVLLEYLVYAGIVTRDERGLSLGGETVVQAATGSTHGEEQLASSTMTRTAGLERVAPETPGWHIIQTEDFYVKVKSDLAVVQDLIDYLGPLRNKIERVRKAQTAQPQQVQSSAETQGGAGVP